MGIIRKAAIGSLIVGLGALAASKNPKAMARMKKAFSTGKRKLKKYTSPKKSTRRATAKSR